MLTRKKLNLESLITKEEHEKFKDIRTEEYPEKKDRLGEGTYGRVRLYKFKDGSYRAGKKMNIGLLSGSADDEARIRKHLSGALNEINILHQLEHERTIRFFGFYLNQDKIIIFMEYMRGSVKHEINESKVIPEIQAMKYFTQATEGLVYLHSRRPNPIVHRDIKCDNLLLNEDKNVKLADFGLAIDLVLRSNSLTDPEHAPNSCRGTYYFMAPEVIRSKGASQEYGRKSDIWSLACTLVEMISGKPPYSELSVTEFLQKSAPGSYSFLKGLFASSSLTYSGELLPETINSLKVLLNAMFIIDANKRPSAEQVLTLAQDTKKLMGKEIDEIVKRGDMYRDGRGVPQSYKEAVKWYRKAASQENAVGQNRLGLMYQNGQGINKSYEEAVIWFIKAADQGNALGQKNLGRMYENGWGVHKSYEQAVNWYRKAAEQGNADGQYNLGLMYRNGWGVDISHEVAMKWFRKAAEQGNADGQYNLGRMYRNGWGVEISQEVAVKWYRKAAEQGNADGRYNLGLMYRNGWGVDISQEVAVKWYRKAAEQENADGPYRLEVIYHNEWVLYKLHKEAMERYRKAAEQGNADGQYNLGLMYRNGWGVDISYEEAVKWFRKAAEQGNADGQYNLGLMYSNGWGVDISYEEAVKWLTKAAEQGYADGQYRLGVICHNGLVVDKSYNEAVQWYRKAAEQGNADGQNNLGDMYYYGWGVEKSYEEAMKWYKKAAEQGNDFARRKLFIVRDYMEIVMHGYSRKPYVYGKRRLRPAPSYGTHPE